MSKVAFISGYYFIQRLNKMSDDVKFMYNSLYDSAKKFFLPNHDVDYIFITNGNDTLPNVKNIKIDRYIDGGNEMLLMKILCVNYLTDQYDYIFVNDGDQIFVDYVGDELLSHDFNAVKHFFSAKSTEVLKSLTDYVTISGDTDNIVWCTGNFFGGKSSVFNRLLTNVIYQDTEFKKYNDANRHYYATYPDEVLLMKFLIENNINYNELESNASLIESDEKSFLGDFIDDRSLYPKFNNVKLLHNTKKNLTLLSEVINYYK